MRDQFNLSGDFRGSIVNINSSLDRARQIARGTMSSAENFAHIEHLLIKLRSQLTSIPQESAETAEAVAISTGQLVEAAAADRPNRPLIKGAVQAVLSSGKALLSASPAVVSTINDIVDLVRKIHDLGSTS
jgi:hypothetical protein